MGFTQDQRDAYHGVILERDYYSSILSTGKQEGKNEFQIGKRATVHQCKASSSGNSERSRVDSYRARPSTSRRVKRRAGSGDLNRQASSSSHPHAQCM